MKTKISISLLMIVIVLAGCHQQDQGDIPVIDVYGNMNNTRDIMLSDIADDVTYIPLETNPECLLSHGYRVVPTSEYFFVSDLDKPLFVFDRDGKFVRKIGSIGQGPGEFRNCVQFHLDKEKREVYILNKNKEFMVYTWEGAFLRKIEFPHRAMLYYKTDSDNYLLFSSNQISRDSLFFRMYFTDKDLNFSGAVAEEQKEGGFYGVSVGAKVWSWDDEYFTQIELCDTIYQVKDNLLTPSYYLDFGRIRLKSEMLVDTDNFEKIMEDHLVFYNFSMIDDKWGIYFIWEKEMYLGFIDPKNQNVVFTSHIDTIRSGLINDIDGGPGYFPHQMFEGMEWITPIQAIEFQDMYENGQFDYPDVIDPDANKKLKDLAAKLKENDNPVLMIVKKKKDLKIE